MHSGNCLAPIPVIGRRAAHILEYLELGIVCRTQPRAIWRENPDELLKVVKEMAEREEGSRTPTGLLSGCRRLWVNKLIASVL
jgi:hypothetical protein